MPIFTQIDYWSPLTSSWEVGHAGINLLNPEAYVQKLAARGIIARAVNKDTGEIMYAEGGDLL